MKKKSTKPQFEQTFIIDRAIWHNAGTFKRYETSLLSVDKGQERMCCLGFVCNQLGIPKEDLLNKRTPAVVGNKWNIPYLLDPNGYHLELSRYAMNVNDDSSITASEREIWLKKLFNEYNLDIKFIGRAPKK